MDKNLTFCKSNKLNCSLTEMSEWVTFCATLVTPGLGVYRLIDTLEDYSGSIRDKYLSVHWQTHTENLENVTFSTEQDVIYPVSKFITFKKKTTDIASSSLSDSTHVQGASLDNYKFRKTAYSFNHRIGSQTDPGEYTMLSAVTALKSLNASNNIAQKMDGCFFNGTRDLYIDHAEAGVAIGGPKNPGNAGNIITIDAETGISVHSNQLATLWKYSNKVDSVHTGVLSHPGGKKEVVCYADI